MLDASIQIGSKVIYHDWSGAEYLAAVVTGFGEKNDRVVVDVTLDNGEQRWGYEDQIEVA